MKKLEKTLKNYFEQHFSIKAESINLLPLSGSNRLYYRISGNGQSAIGTYNTDVKENKAFITFSKHFKKQGLPVPEIYALDLSQHIYLQEDFGDTMLFDLVTKYQKNQTLPDSLKQLYFKVLDDLFLFQTKGGEKLDYSVCYPRQSFDKQSMMWDLNYFKYHFLKLAQIPFDEQLLEDDFHQFTDYLLQAPVDYFMYRDFQSRNIMIVNNEPRFIDYQGGRKGALQYDVASLLFDAKADISQDLRDELLHYYTDILGSHRTIDTKKFHAYYLGYVMIRIMQAMGAFGYRGFFERKLHFLKSIPFALKNIQYVLNNIKIPIKIPHLLKVLHAVSNSEKLMHISDNTSKKFKVEINSFSYRKGIPVDMSENSGGYVFDCRSIYDPYQFENLKFLTGKDKEVKQFFKKNEEMSNYLNAAFQLIDATVKKYLKRNNKYLQVNFGCIGGQHRSVYATDKLAAHLAEKYDIDIVVNHRDLKTDF